ncbi:MAG TPA: VWA domain-containing protein [Candidatus Uhrbacteria bacterium]|nr:VWA domain-containing protein [Candidatus Uhrbacteria bacterium]
MADKKDDHKLVPKTGQSGLVKSGGAPDIVAMRKKLGSSLPIKSSGLGQVSKNTLIADLQVLMMFDITGSMFPYFKLVREKLKEIIARIQADKVASEFAVFAFRNHGDEGNYEQIFYTSPLTSSREDLYAHIAEIKKGGGGQDALTCMEECLEAANKLLWQPRAAKAVVIIGDMPPHGVIDPVSVCPGNIDYQEEIDQLKNKGVKIYSVYCGEKSGDVEMFFKFASKQTNGKFLKISEIDILAELLIGICMRETGQLSQFLEEVQKSKKFKPGQKKTLLMLKD